MTVFSTMLVSSYSYEAINRSSNHHLCVFKISYLILGCGGSTEMEIKSYHFQKLEDVRNELTITHVNKKIKINQKPGIFTSAWWRFTQILKAIAGKHLYN